ncbi:hypothetical protein C0J52_06037 [Blattella germanica]|nr:hypothetical protein C0J52_06037 [Blattella germanica]
MERVLSNTFTAASMGIDIVSQIGCQEAFVTVDCELFSGKKPFLKNLPGLLKTDLVGVVSLLPLRFPFLFALNWGCNSRGAVYWLKSLLQMLLDEAGILTQNEGCTKMVWKKEFYDRGPRWRKESRLQLLSLLFCFSPSLLLKVKIPFLVRRNVLICFPPILFCFYQIHNKDTTSIVVFFPPLRCFLFLIIYQNIKFSSELETHIQLFPYIFLLFLAFFYLLSTCKISLLVSQLYKIHY